MRSIILFSVILVTFQITLAKKSDLSALLLFSQQNTNSCRTPGLQCKDCETIQYCSTTLESLFSIRCADQSRTNTYCDSETNTCVAEIPAVCKTPEKHFHCPGVGYYPDLEDCANYYYCDENKEATKFACPVGSNWVQGNETCTAGLYCRSYSAKLGQCKSKINKLIAYTPDKNLYVLCLTSGSLLFQCPNKWEVFDETEVTCKFECTQNGFFPNPVDPRQFYACTKVGKIYEGVLLECPLEYEFVELIPGQGICTYKTTTTTTETPTTEAQTETPTDAPTELPQTESTETIQTEACQNDASESPETEAPQNYAPETPEIAETEAPQNYASETPEIAETGAPQNDAPEIPENAETEAPAEEQQPATAENQPEAVPALEVNNDDQTVETIEDTNETVSETSQGQETVETISNETPDSDDDLLL